jgi:hypothetical protein
LKSVAKADYNNNSHKTKTKKFIYEKIKQGGQNMKYKIGEYYKLNMPYSYGQRHYSMIVQVKDLIPDKGMGALVLTDNDKSMDSTGDEVYIPLESILDSKKLIKEEPPIAILECSA